MDMLLGLFRPSDSQTGILEFFVWDDLSSRSILEVWLHVLGETGFKQGTYPQNPSCGSFKGWKK